MRDAWRIRTRDWLARVDKWSPRPEQEFAAWAAARAVKASHRAPLTVCLWGETGSGKTSLIRQAIQQHADPRQRLIVRATANEWSQALQASSEDGTLGESVSGYDLALCTDLHELADAREAGDRLASWCDLLRDAGISLIVTADRLPSEIPRLSPRLLNRLQGGLLAGIHRPTATQARLALGLPALEFIADAVADDFHVPRGELCSGSRMLQVKIPRGVAMALAREFTTCPLTTIGRFFGCRSHSAVVRNCSRLQQLLPEAPSLRQQVQRLRLKLQQELSRHCG